MWLECASRTFATDACQVINQELAKGKPGTITFVIIIIMIIIAIMIDMIMTTIIIIIIIVIAIMTKTFQEKRHSALWHSQSSPDSSAAHIG